MSATLSQAQESMSLQPIVITAARFNQALIEAPATVTVISRQEIEARGAENVLEALRGDSSMSFQGKPTGGRRVLSLRGVESRHMLFLVDGKRIAATDGIVGHSDYQYDWIPLHAIERIEVVRGPMSVLYGSEAIGGVVNIITRRASKALEADASVEGTFVDSTLGGDGWRTGAYVSSPLSTTDSPSYWNGAMAVNASHRNALTLKEDRALSAQEGADKLIGFGRLTWRPSPNHALSLDATGGSDERWFNTRESAGKKRDYESRTQIDRQHFSLDWNADWRGNAPMSTMLRAYASRVDVSNTRTNGVTPLRAQTMNERVLEGTVDTTVQAVHRLTAGFELRNEALENAGLQGGESDVMHRALFIQDAMTLTTHAKLYAGLRYDDHARFGGFWSPRLVGTYQLAPSWWLKAGYAHGFKAPTLKQITPDYAEDEGPFNYIGNAAIRPETNRASEITLHYARGAYESRITLFDNRVKNLIAPKLLRTEGTRNFYQFDNVSGARLRGLEWSGTAALGLGISSGLSYAYLDAIDHLGTRLERRPRHSASARLDWARGPWSVGARLEVLDDQVIAPAGKAPLSVAALTMLNFTGGYVLNDRVRFSLGIDNATNMRPADKSPLLNYAERPRAVRLGVVVTL